MSGTSAKIMILYQAWINGGSKFDHGIIIKSLATPGPPAIVSINNNYVNTRLM